MDKNYYKEYYHLEREHWWFVIRAKIIEERIKPFLKFSSNKIFNMGVATGRTSEVLSQFGPVTSVEFDEDCRKFTMDKTGMEILPGSVLDIQSEDNQFDITSAFDVIEHVEDDKLALNELIRITKPGGLIYITVPAYQFLWSNHDVINHHFRRYTTKTLQAIQKNTNTQIVYRTYFNSILFIPIAIFRLLSRLIPSRLYRKGAGSDNTIVNNNSFINKIMYWVFNIERSYLNLLKFPFGISLMFILRKNEI